MVNKLTLLPKIIGNNLFRYFNKFRLMPFNITLQLTQKCNLQCKTCNIWKSNSNDLSLKKWKKILKSIENPYFISITGGEPFLRKDIGKILSFIIINNKPRYLNIATNGVLTAKIKETIIKINPLLKKNKVILSINISLDGLPDVHNTIRGKKIYYKVIKTYHELKNLNVDVSFNTVISKHNYPNIKYINEYCKQNNMNLLFEPAQKRFELNNKKDDFVLDNKKLKEILTYLTETTKNKLKIKNILRKNYYKTLAKELRYKKKIYCYSGIASAYISSEGKILKCPVLGNELGDLKNNDFNFKKMWFSDKTINLIIKSKNKKCFCTLANAHHTNLVCNPLKL